MHTLVIISLGLTGADSLANDKLGSSNLSIEGHGEALAFIKRFNVPMLVTGGGAHQALLRQSL